MTTQIHKYNTPMMFKWHPEEDDDIIKARLFFWAGPFILAILVLGMTSLVDIFLWEDASSPWWEDNATVTRWNFAPAVLTLPFCWLLTAVFFMSRRGYVEYEAVNDITIQLDHAWKQLPSDLRAETVGARTLCFKFDAEGNREGMVRCMQIITEAKEAAEQRKLFQQAREAKDPELALMRRSVQHYQKQTTEIFKGEIEARKDAR